MARSRGNSNRSFARSTFCRMRYHRAVARIRQASFALQLFRMISFILFVEEKLAEPPAELLQAQVALDEAAVANRNLAGLFRDDDRDSVGFLAEPESGPVAEPEITVEVLALGERKNAGGRNNAVASEDQPPVM